MAPLARSLLRVRCTALLVGCAVVALACLTKFSFESSVLLEVLGQPRPPLGATSAPATSAGRTSAGAAPGSGLGSGAAAAGTSSEFARRVSLLSATSAAAFKEVAALQDLSARAFKPGQSARGLPATPCPNSSSNNDSNNTSSSSNHNNSTSSRSSSSSSDSNCLGSGRIAPPVTSPRGPQSQVTGLPGAPGASSQPQVARIDSTSGPREELRGAGGGGAEWEKELEGAHREGEGGKGKTGGILQKVSVPAGGGGTGGEKAKEGGGGAPVAPADLICRDDTPHSRNFRKGTQKFLMVGRMNEQLSKARKHLAELVALALLANRTLVLPHCGNSRLGPRADYRWPLCTYFDLATLPRALVWVSEPYFQQQLWPQIQRRRREERKARGEGEGKRGGESEGAAAFLMTKPGAQCSFVKAMHTIGVGLRHLGSQGDPRPYQDLPPMRYLRPDHPIPTVCMAECPLRSRQRVCADKLVTHSPVLGDADVLIVVKGTAFPCLAKGADSLAGKVLFNLQYAPRLVSLVDAVARTHLGGAPFVALQWRTERAVRGYVKPKGLQACAARAVVAVGALQRDMARGGGGGGGGGTKGNAPRIFFATDVTSDRKVLSTSWRSAKKSEMTFAWRAAGVIREKLKPFSISTFIPAAGEADLGIQGILDKLLCAGAPILLTPPEECKGRHGYKDKFGSSFSEEICWLRVKFKRKPCQVW